MSNIIKINLNKPFIALNGEQINDITQATFLSEHILMQENFGFSCIKVFNWAAELFNKQEISLDQEDADKLYRGLENLDFKPFSKIPVLVKAQILQTISMETRKHIINNNE